MFTSIGHKVLSDTVFVNFKRQGVSRGETYVYFRALWQNSVGGIAEILNDRSKYVCVLSMELVSCNISED